MLSVMVVLIVRAPAYAARQAGDSDTKFSRRCFTEILLRPGRGAWKLSQVALVAEVKDNLTPERHASDQMLAVQRRMLCELWRSDAIALRFIQDPPMSSSWVNDLQEWAYDCVVAKAVEAVF